MKEKLSDTIRSVYINGRKWLSLEVEYLKLTIAEKTSVLISTLIAGAVCALLGLIVIVLISFTLVDVFASIMPQACAYLCVAGIYVLLMVLVFLLRGPLIISPISKFITKLFIEKKSSHHGSK